MTKICQLVLLTVVGLSHVGWAKDLPAQKRIVELAAQISQDLPPEMEIILRERLAQDARRLPRLSSGLGGLPSHSDLGREMHLRGEIIGRELASILSLEKVTTGDVTYLLQQILLAQLIEASGFVSREDQHDLALWQSLGVGAASYMLFQQLNPDLILEILHRGDIAHINVMTAEFLAALGLPYATLITNGVSASFQSREAKLVLYSDSLAKMQDSIYRVFRQHTFWRAVVRNMMRATPPEKRDLTERFLREWLNVRQIKSVFLSASIYRHRLDLVSRLLATLRDFGFAGEGCASELSAGLFRR